ncbi:cell division protein FtsQ/DivIB [Pseudalkalibacillus berkeleyi]|uniref:Cell division protein DivIB n=1 Tax=Pseudalkalibacillus berkeleyi TaxID=1069813 RepID=A0ABS9GZI3_9BACL|nr:cell division protein FtsQ/DivIB [Pseudalkalibacillus berkeleyi]MCF6137015.1 cell division protein FtsQ/DivIB [Pseudalkalibacillus berkeleyi]
MENKKVTTLEDRIPKLKEQRKQKANRRMIFYVSFFFLLILVIVYFQSPLSNVKTIEIKGNEVIPEEKIMSQITLSTNTNYWSVNEKAVEAEVKKFVQVESVNVDKIFPNKVKIQVTEFEKVAFAVNEGSYYPLLQNGKTLPKVSESTVPTNAPILIGWGDNELTERMAAELSDLSASIRIRISEIHHSPTENDSQRITLYMNDGYEVQSRIHNFAEYMQYYPSIVDKLEGSKEGIIYMSESPRFEPFEKEDGKEESTDEG